eukprot:5809_1
MGACNSVEGIDYPVVQQNEPAISIDSSHICSSNTTLKMKHLDFDDSGAWVDIGYTVSNREMQAPINDHLATLNVKGSKKISTASLKVCNMYGKVIVKAEEKPKEILDWPTFNIIDAKTNKTIAILQKQKKAFTCKRKYILYDNNENIVYEIDGVRYKTQFVIRNSVGDIIAKSSEKLIQKAWFSKSFGFEIAQGNDIVIMTVIMAIIHGYFRSAESG